MKKYINLLSRVGILVVIFGTIYMVTQQSLRQSAYDPSIQIADDTLVQLDKSYDSKTVTPQELTAGQIDISTSLKPFIMIYDKSGDLISSNARLDNAVPVVPRGVLTHASVGNDNMVTWQPRSGTRSAVVAAAGDHYYVVSGRNLRVVEKREFQSLSLSAFGGLVCLVIVLGTDWLKTYLDQAKK